VAPAGQSVRVSGPRGKGRTFLEPLSGFVRRELGSDPSQALKASSPEVLALVCIDLIKSIN